LNRSGPETAHLRRDAAGGMVRGNVVTITVTFPSRKWRYRVVLAARAHQELILDFG